MAGIFNKDLRGGLRMLQEEPGLYLRGRLVAGSGHRANTAIFTIINAVFLHPLPVEGPPARGNVHRDTLTIDANTNFQLTVLRSPTMKTIAIRPFSRSGYGHFPHSSELGRPARATTIERSLVSGISSMCWASALSRPHFIADATRSSAATRKWF